MTGPRIDPYADLYAPASSQGPASPQGGGDPYADLYAPAQRSIPSAAGRDVTGQLQNTSRFDTNAPLSLAERAAGQVVGFGRQAVEDPIGTAAGIITAPLESFAHATAPSIDEAAALSDPASPERQQQNAIRRAKGWPELPTTVEGVTGRERAIGLAQTAANVMAGPVGSTVGRVAGPIAGSVASLAPLGAAYSPDDPLAGAIAMPVIGGLIHQTGKAAVDPLRAAIATHIERQTSLERLRPGADELAGLGLRRQIAQQNNTAPVMGRIAERETALSRLSEQPKPEPARATTDAQQPTISEDVKSDVTPLPEQTAPETIAAPAFQTRDGRVFQGAVHVEAHEAARQAGAIRPNEGTDGGADGFLTSAGRFVDRAEAEQMYGGDRGGLDALDLPTEQRAGIEPQEVGAPPEIPGKTGSAAVPTPRGVVEMPTSEIHADAERFQFKTGTDAQGVGKGLRSVQRWNPELAGVAAVWRDPANGQTYVVNGHHRLALAQRLGVEAMPVRYVEAPDAAQAKAKGAVINIAEGRGTPVDVAQFLRETKMSVDQLRESGVDVRESLASDGLALAKLAPDVFDQVATGKLTNASGVAIGDITADPALQRETVTAIRGKRLSGDEVREVARQVRDAGAIDASQVDLLGESTVRKGLYVERAQLASQIKKRIAADKHLFGFLTKGSRAEELSRAGETRIDVEAAEKIAGDSARLDELFTRLYTRAGPLSRLLTEGAERVARGEKSAAVAAELYPRVQDAVRTALAEPGTGAHGGVEGRPAPGGAGPDAPAEPGPGRVAEQSALFSRAPDGPAVTERASVAPRRALASPSSPGPAAGQPGAGTGSAAPAAPATPTGPVVAKASGKFAQMRQTLRRIFVPASRTPDATVAAHVVRHHAADLALRSERAAEALKDFGKALGHLPEADRLAFIDRIETGRPQPTPDLTAAAAEIRHWLDTGRDDIQKLGTGALEHFIQDYFPHIWQDPQGAAQILNQMDQGKRPLTGSGRFLKQRTIPTTKDGIAAGLTPISDNPVDLTLLKLREMHRYLAGQRILKELKEKQLLKFVSAFEPKPAGYTWLEDKTGTVYGPPHVTVTEAFDAHTRAALTQVIQNLGGLVHERKASVGRHGPGTTLGVASTSGDYMATRGATPDSVIEHELGHILDTRLGLGKKLMALKGGVRELEALADLRHQGVQAGPSFKKYVREPEELIANAVNALIHIPDEMASTAPTVKAALERILGADKRTRALLDIRPSLALGTAKFDVPTGGFIVRGRYAAPEPVATVVNNYLSPGLAGNAIYDVYRTVGNTMNQAQLGLSAFHLGMVSIDASVSSAALGVEKLLGGDIRGAARDLARGVVPLAAPVHTYLQGSKVLREGLVPGSAGGDFPALVEAMRQGGGRVRQDQMYANEAAKRLREALRQGGVKGYAKAGAFALPALFEKASAPMMEHFVPRMKLGVFADLARHELAKLPPGATVEQSRAAMAKVWDSVDNRMGQLVYDNLFWHRVTKDMAMASIRSVGWNLGTIREIAGGVGDLASQPIAKVKGGSMELTHRGAYVIALPFVIGLYGATLQYLMTGKGPDELKDYFFPKTGRDDREGNPERVVLPSYMKDVFAYARHPYQTVKHKLHPLVGTLADMLENEDFFGNEIRNPDDPILTQMAQEARHLVGELEPMGVENARQEHAEGQSLGVVAANFIGVTRAPKEETRTAAQNRMTELLARRGGGKASPEDVAARRDRSALLGDVRRGAAGATDRVGEAVRSGQITERQGMNVLRSGLQDGTVERFKRLTLPEALEVYGMASAEERAAWLPLLGKKLASAKRSSYTAEQWERLGQQARQINTDTGAPK